VLLGSATLSGGQATLNTPIATVGSHTITATYRGDTANAASSSSPVTVAVNIRNTSTALAAAPGTAYQGQTVALTATISGANPSGSVSFSEGGTNLGSANVSGGIAVFSASFATVGSHTVSASYPGDANNGASSSNTVSVQVLVGPVPPAPPAPVVKYEYDANGNLTKTIQAPGVTGFNFTTTQTYDALNRLKDSTNAKSGKTQFGYNGREDLTQVTDPRNLVTQYPRNGLGDATQLISPDTGTAGHTYDAAGNLKTLTDSRGVLATHSYDALNRLTSTVYSMSGQPSQSFGWNYDETGTGFANGKGRLTSTTHPSGSTQYTYDAHGRVLTDTQRVNPVAGGNSATLTSTVSYSYDGAGRISSITYPSGAVVTYTYVNGQLSSISLNAGGTISTLLSQIQWEPFGPVKSWQWHMASGTQAHERMYDTTGRLVRYRLGNLIRDLGYDAADRITSYTHYDATTGAAQPTYNQSFVYDELGRLTQTTLASGSWSFAYDANGNRTIATASGSTQSYTISPTSNRITSISNPTRSFSYDNAGNTTAEGNYSATYDLAGRLATLTKAGVTTTYSYSGLGQRVRKASSSGASTTVVFMYGLDGQLLGEYDVAGNTLREHVWLSTTPVATMAPAGANPPTVHYVHADHIDTPRLVVDKNNSVRWRWFSEPFGVNAPEENPSGLGQFALNLRFPGQYFDQESGLHYNYFRNYDSSVGRYSQSDPIGLAAGINTYSYVEGNPLSYADPTGLQAFLPGPGGVPIRVPLPPAAPMQNKNQGGYDPIKDQYRPAPGSSSDGDNSNSCCQSYTDVYEANDGKHGPVPRGDISAEPSMPGIALQNSVGVGRARIGYDGLSGQIVVFRLTRTDEQRCIRYWHGYVVYQRDLTPEQWKAGRDAGFPNWPRKPK
jgi:RHS repeat-associated protein